MSYRRLFFVLGFLTIASSLSAQSLKSQYLKAPLVFEPNRGQAAPEVRFLSRGNGHRFLLSDTDAVFTFTDLASTVTMNMVGRNPMPHIEGATRLPGVTNYLYGNDPRQWRTSIPHYAKIRYSDVYPGIDLVYYGSDGELEYDFEIKPYTDPSTIQIEFHGAENITVDASGDLVLRTAHGEIRHRRPVAYQKHDGLSQSVDARFRLHDNRVTFELGSYDRRFPLLIDPKLVWSTYIGSPGGDQGNDVAVDGSGNVYVSGLTGSFAGDPNGVLQVPSGGGLFEAFVTKIDAAGSLLYTTYLGGSGTDEAHSIALDPSGNVYVVGYTTSSDFPIVGGFQARIGGLQDAYFLRLSSGGDMIQYSTYLGGVQSDRAYGVAVDSLGNAYVAGATFSSNFPISNAFQTSFGGGQGDAFLTKINASGTLAFSTYLGGNGWDQAYDVALDGDTNIILTGFTTSNGVGRFPTFNALYPVWIGGEDVFITKFDNTGRNLIFSTYFGGSDNDDGIRLTVDRDNNIYVAGYTRSVNFPLKNAPQLVLNGGLAINKYDAFLLKLHPDGRDAYFSTYIGGDDNDGAVSVAVDDDGFIYLTGFTTSLQFYAINAITGTGGFLRGLQDAFVMKIVPDASVVVFSSYLGGFGTDGGSSIAVDASRNVYLTGFTTSVDFPIAGNSFQTGLGGGQDGFVVKIDATDVKTTSAFSFPSNGGVQTATAGQSSNTVFGYVAADVVSGPSPMGLEIVDLRSLGTLINEISIPVPVPDWTGRVYVSTSSGDTTAMTIVNPNDEEVQFDFYFTTKAGATDFFGKPIKIPAHAQVSGLLSALPFGLPFEQIGTMTFQTNLPVSVVAFRVMGSGASGSANAYLPIVNPYLANNRPVVIPQIVDGGGWSTQFYLINLTEDEISGEIRIFKNENQSEPGHPAEMETDLGTASVFSYSIPPRALYTLIGSGALVDLTVGYAEIVPSAGSTTPLSYAVLLGRDTGFTATTVEAGEPTREFTMYAEVTGNYPEDLASTPAITLANTLDSPATVNLSLIRFDGTDSGLSAQVTLQPKGHLSRFLYEIPGFEVLPTPFEGMVKATTSQPGVTFVGFRARYNEQRHFLVTATGPLKNLGNTNPIIFPHLIDGGGYATQFILLNAGGAGATGTIRYLSPSGSPLNISVVP